MSDTNKNSIRKNKVVQWLSERFPINEYVERYFTHYYLPKNLNFWYFFGSLSLFTLFLQVLTGVWLTLFYIPTPEEAFSSIEMLMRDIPYGWLFRYLHSTGASAFFILIYAHIFRSLLYGSYKKPRELVWFRCMSLYYFITGGISRLFMYGRCLYCKK